MQGAGDWQKVHSGGNLENQKSKHLISGEHSCRSLYRHYLSKPMAILWGKYLYSLFCQRKILKPREVKKLNTRFQTRVLQSQGTGLNYPANTQNLDQRKGGGERWQEVSRCMLSLQKLHFHPATSLAFRRTQREITSIMRDFEHTSFSYCWEALKKRTDIQDSVMLMSLKS